MNKILRFSDSEKVFQCPICKTDLKLKQKSLFCSNHHCFDISKTGYVNFAVGTKSSKHCLYSDKELNSLITVS